MTARAYDVIVIGAGPTGENVAAEFQISRADQDAFAARGYLAESDLATTLYLSLTLERPLFLEGEAGVGKTDVARTLAAVTGGTLIRLQCYEWIDAATAITSS